MVDDMSKTFLDMKKSFYYVGDNSTFQQRITWILVIQWISFSFIVSSMAYFFRSPNFECRIGDSEAFVPCTQNIACKMAPSDYRFAQLDEGHFSKSRQYSIAYEFYLYCDRSEQPAWAQSVFFLGSFMSGYLFSYISVRIGRRPVLMIIILSSIASLVICACAWNFYVFIFGYFVLGFSIFGYETNVYIYIGEISATRFRMMSINMLTMVWAGTPIFLPLLRLLPTWRYNLFFFACIWAITLPFAYKCFLESPRFLLTKKCYTQAKEIFYRISVTNKRPPYKFKLIDYMDQYNETFLRYGTGETTLYKPAEPLSVRQYNYLHLFHYLSLKKITFVLMFWRMFQFFMYYGLNLALYSVLYSYFLLTIVISLAAVSEVFGSFGMRIMTSVLAKKFKLDVMKIAILVTSLCLSVMWFIRITPDCTIFEDRQPFCLQIFAMILLVFVIKFCNTVFVSGLIVYSQEVFPSPVRSLGYGFTTTFGRLGTIIVPFYIKYMRARYEAIIPLCFLAPIGYLCWYFCRHMPYTEYVEVGMRETIREEYEEQNKLIEMNVMGNSGGTSRVLSKMK